MKQLAQEASGAVNCHDQVGLRLIQGRKQARAVANVFVTAQFGSGQVGYQHAFLYGAEGQRAALVVCHVRHVFYDQLCAGQGQQ